MVRAKVLGGRIHIFTPSPDPQFKLNLERCRSLPASTFDRSSRTWSTPATRTAAVAVRDVFSGQVEWCEGFDKLLGEQPRLEAEGRWKSNPDPIPGEHGESWAHQRAAFHFCKELDAALLYMGMGTGKSRVIVQLVRALELERVLILCPLSVVPVWPLQFREHWPQLETIPLSLNKGLVRKRAEECEKFLAYADTPKVIICNYESAWRPALKTLFLKQQWDLVVCDESQKIMSAGSKVSLFADTLSRRSKKRICLTGTPNPKDCLNYYGQFRFLDSGILGSSFARFRARYAVLKADEFDGNQVVRVIGYQNQEELAEVIDPYTFIAKSDDVLDLPPVTHVYKPVQLDKKEWSAYVPMKKDFVVWMKSQGDNFESVSAANLLVQTIRLQQIANGFIQDKKEGIFQRVGNSKERALFDLLEGIDEPVAVFCKFREDLNAVERCAEKLEQVYGEISGRRKDVHGKWTSRDPSLLGVQLQAGGLGIDLTRARYAVYFSIDYDLGAYDQSLARLHRPGQERPITFFHIVAMNTIEEVIYESIDRKRSHVDHLRSLMTHFS